MELSLILHLASLQARPFAIRLPGNLNGISFFRLCKKIMPISSSEIFDSKYLENYCVPGNNNRGFGCHNI